MAQITVIVPVYKVEPYLARCVDSILCQSFQEFDLILVDDGSPDRCPAICDEYAKLDARITVIHKENGGLSDARNAGINWAMENSSSDWLAFVDSDDYLHVDYLQILYDTALKEDADLVICDFCRVNDQEEPIESNHSFFQFVTEDKSMLFHCLSSSWRIDPAWNKLYSKRIFVDLRFEFKKIHEDEYAIHHILWNCRKAAFIRQQLYYYRARPNSIMAKESVASVLDEFEALILQKEFSLQHFLPVRDQQIYDNSYAAVVDRKSDFTQQDKVRFIELKQRYKSTLALSHINLKTYMKLYFNRPYRALCKILSK